MVCMAKVVSTHRTGATPLNFCQQATKGFLSWLARGLPNGCAILGCVVSDNFLGVCCWDLGEFVVVLFVFVFVFFFGGFGDMHMSNFEDGSLVG